MSKPSFGPEPTACINLNLAGATSEWEIYHCVPTPLLSTTTPLILNDTFGSSEGGLRSFSSVSTMVLVKGQAVFTGPCHHLRVGLQLLGSAQDFQPVDSPGVGVWHVQLAGHWIGCQVISVCWVVAVLKKKKTSLWILITNHAFLLKTFF